MYSHHTPLLFQRKQCNNTTPTNILIIEKQTQNITTFPVKHNSSKNTTGSPSTSLDPPSINSDKLHPNFLNSKRRTRLNVIPISSQPQQNTISQGGILAIVLPIPTLSPDRMDVDNHPIKERLTKPSPTKDYLSSTNSNNITIKRGTRLIVPLLQTTNDSTPSTTQRAMNHLEEISSVATTA